MVSKNTRQAAERFPRPQGVANGGALVAFGHCGTGGVEGPGTELGLDWA